MDREGSERLAIPMASRIDIVDSNVLLQLHGLSYLYLEHLKIEAFRTGWFLGADSVKPRFDGKLTFTHCNDFGPVATIVQFWFC